MESLKNSKLMTCDGQRTCWICDDANEESTGDADQNADHAKPQIWQVVKISQHRTNRWKKVEIVTISKESIN